MKVEKINYEIEWKKFRKGYSFFIPCLNPQASLTDIKAELKRFRYKVVYRVVIEDGVRGVRIWRI